MKSSKKLLFIGSLGVFLIGGAFCFLVMVLAQPDLPEYNGKTVAEWFYGEDGHPGRQKTIEAARIAYSNMGTNCVPYLMGRLKSSDTFWSDIYGKIFAKLPVQFQRKLTPAFDSDFVHYIAINHLTNLHINSLDPFASELIELLKNEKSKKHGNSAMFLLKKMVIRIDDKRVKTSILCDLLDYPLFDQRLEMSILLSKTDPSKKNGIPILLNAITNRNEVYLMIIRNGLRRPPSFIDRMVTQKQEEALRALELVAPEIADTYTQ